MEKELQKTLDNKTIQQEIEFKKNVNQFPNEY
jgi:hypothetical protein